MRSGQGRVLKGLLIMFSLQRIMTFLKLHKAAEAFCSLLGVKWAWMLD